MNHKRDPVPRHNLRDRLVVGQRQIEVDVVQERRGRAVDFTAGVEAEFPHCRRVVAVVRLCFRHKVRRAYVLGGVRGENVGDTSDDDVREPGYALPEGRVIVLWRVKLEEFGKECGTSSGEESFCVGKNLRRRVDQ